jgi:hypothetical protein
MFVLMVGGAAVALIALAAWAGGRFFSSRQKLVTPVSHDAPRELFSKVLTAFSCFGMLGCLVGMMYRRTHELYAAELGIILVSLPIGLLAACANRYLYGRWI